MDRSGLLMHLLDQVREVRRAYNTGKPGVTVEDMRAAAERYLVVKNAVDVAAGRKPRKITASSIAGMLRGL